MEKSLSMQSAATDERFMQLVASLRRGTFFMHLLGITYVIFFGCAMFVEYYKFDYVSNLPQINRGSRIREEELEEYFHKVKSTMTETESGRLSRSIMFSLASDETNARAVLMGFRQTLMLIYFINVGLCIVFVILGVQLYRLPSKAIK